MERPHGPTGVGLGLRSRYLERVAEGALEGVVDFLEISPENFMHRGGRSHALLERIADRHPILSHGLMLSLGGTGPFDPAYLDTLRDFLSRTGSPWHSDHLCFSGLEGTLLHDLLPVPFSTASARHVAERVMRVRDHLGRPMAVENISWYAHGGASDRDEAEFIAEVCGRADCGLLLDVNNCWVNAKNHGTDVMDFLSKVPLDRVIQIHVAGHERYDDDLYVDTHGARAEPRVHELLAWVVERTGPVPVLLERDNNLPPLEELVDELAGIRATYEAAIARHRQRSIHTEHTSHATR
ncbi:MAG: DUF692 domain-containing protein [Deltaproteobacteria bacterium]|nr:MAG: DUF692 domain-containing protein [Deltaproteobacteria bacterium]